MNLSNKLKLGLLSLLLPIAATGQADLFVASSGNMYFYGNADIFGNVTNNGTMGTVGNVTITFFGQNWVNGSTASFTETGGTGVYSFTQPRPAPYASNFTQTLNGGYAAGTQPAFPNLNINNANNVSMLLTKTRVVDNLSFTTGKIVLNDFDMVLGNATTITGYNQNSYVVSNSTSGHLVKDAYTGAFVFPVGKGTAGVTDYAPAKITNTSSNGIHVNVSDYASTALNAPRTTNDGIDRTWNIYADNSSGNSVIDLQHDMSSNQPNFKNSSHFVTRYIGAAPNTAGDMMSVDKWERNISGPGTTPGTLTTGAAIATASERSRTYTTFATAAGQNTANYTKATGPLCLNARAYLEGALMANGGATAPDGRPLMRDNLRNSPFTGLNYIPTTNPYQQATAHVDVTARYTALPPQSDPSYAFLKSVLDPAEFTVSGQDALVDWMWVELRDKNNRSTVVSNRAALIQRDGDIVDVDGKSCVSFPGVALDDYYVAVRHRDHLGAMTQSVQTYDNMQSLVDMSITSTPMYDFGPGGPGGFNYTGLATNNNVIVGRRALWAGDFNADGKVKFDNPAGDANVVNFDVLTAPGQSVPPLSNFNNAVDYWNSDYNMDSKAKLDNPQGDLNFLNFQVLNYPLQPAPPLTNFNFFLQQLP